MNSHQCRTISAKMAETFPFQPPTERSSRRNSWISAAMAEIMFSFFFLNSKPKPNKKRSGKGNPNPKPPLHPETKESNKRENYLMGSRRRSPRGSPLAYATVAASQPPPCPSSSSAHTPSHSIRAGALGKTNATRIRFDCPSSSSAHTLSYSIRTGTLGKTNATLSHSIRAGGPGKTNANDG